MSGLCCYLQRTFDLARRGSGHRTVDSGLKTLPSDPPRATSGLDRGSVLAHPAATSPCPSSNCSSDRVFRPYQSSFSCVCIITIAVHSHSDPLPTLHRLRSNLARSQHHLRLVLLFNYCFIYCRGDCRSIVSFFTGLLSVKQCLK